jgi:cardiolipin synthase (CMP-forming)
MPKRTNKQKTIARAEETTQSMWTISNLISAMRLLLGLPVFLLLREPWANRWWVLLLFLLAYVSDLADGYIARKSGTVTDAGKIIDPLADKVFVLLAALGLLVAHTIPLWYVACVVARDITIFTAGTLLRRRTGIVAASNMTGKAAVVSIGLVLMASLFRGVFDSFLYTLLLLVSLALMAASLIAYGQRFYTMISKR